MLESQPAERDIFGHYVKPPEEAPGRSCRDREAHQTPNTFAEIGLSDSVLDYWCPDCGGYRESVDREHWSDDEQRKVGQLMGEHIRALGGIEEPVDD